MRFNRITRILLLAAVLAVSQIDTLSAQGFTVSPSTLAFTALTNGALPAQQTVSVSAGGSFSVTVGYTPAGDWLTVTPTSGATPAQLTVSVNKTNLSGGGTFFATIILTGPGPGGSIGTIPVSYTLSTGATMSAAPSSLTFNYQIGGTLPSSKDLTISTNGPSISISASAAILGGSNWLAVTPTTASGTPATLQVSVTPGALSPGTYSGSITIASAGANNSPVLVPVTLVVSNLPTLNASKSSLNFYYQAGGNTPSPQTVDVTSSGNPISFFVSFAAQTGNWLVVSPINGSTPSPLQVSVNALNLPLGTYQGSMTITAVGAVNPTTVIPITMIVSNNPLLSTTPASLSFTYLQGMGAPAAQPVTLGSTGSVINYTVGATTTGGGNWLTFTPQNGATPSNVSAGIDAAIAGSLAPGSYSGTLVFTAPGAGNSPVNVPVTLTVSNNPLLTASPATLNFAYQTGQNLPAGQAVSIGSSAGPLTFTTAVVGSPAWVSINTSATTTPAVMSVTVIPGAMAPGTYNAEIQIASSAAGNSPLVVPVKMVVSTTPLITISPAVVDFTAAVGTGSLLGPRQATVTSTDGTALSFTAAGATQSNGSWLFVSPTTGSTPTILSMVAQPTGLPIGAYHGTVTVSSGGINNSPQTLAVNLTITPNAQLAVAPANLSFQQNTGGANPQAQTIQVTATGQTTTVAFAATAQTVNGGGWLSVTPANGNTPGSVAVSVNGQGLLAGTYNGTVTLTSGAVSNSPLTIPVTLTVADIRNVVPTPTSLAFAWQQGGQNPAPQQLAIALSQGSGSFSAATTVTSPTGGTWLLPVTPASGNLPAGAAGTVLTVTVNPAGLAPGSYSGTVDLTVPGASNSPLRVPVTLNVTGNTLTATPATLTFTQQSGSSPPGPQTVTLTAGSATTFSSTIATAAQGWLSVSPASGSITGGTAGAAVSVSVNGSNLAVGAYTGTISFSAVGASNNPVLVTVTLNVTAPPISPLINAVFNSASQSPVDLAPGMIATIYGSSIGPASGVGTVLTPPNCNPLVSGSVCFVSDTIGNVRVLFDGLAAPLTYASASQINVVVPYGVANRISTRIQVEYLGVRSPAVEVRIAQASPGIYTANSSGTGAGAILNENYSLNNGANPAPKGKVILLWATGEGSVTPGSPDGLVIPATSLRKPLREVKATIGGVDAKVEYAGSAPFFVSGAMQVNIRVPDSVPSGTQLILISVGGIPSQPGVTVQVQ